jgi:hypothetical protein
MNRVISGAKRAVHVIREHFAFSRFLGLRLFAFSGFAPFRVFVAHADSARIVMAIWCGVSKREFREPHEISQHDVNA